VTADPGRPIPTMPKTTKTTKTIRRRRGASNKGRTESSLQTQSGAVVRPPARQGLKTYSLRSRPSKVHVGQFARSSTSQDTVGRFLSNLPDFLSAKDLREFCGLVRSARSRERAVVFGMGAHVIKVGLSPVLIDLIREGWITALVLNGAGVIHDFEIAFAGQTSEDVEDRIRDGRFGMARETGELINRAINEGARAGLGLGEAVGRMIAASDFPHKDLSLLAAAQRQGIPATVHVALGTDTIHVHPQASGEALGKTSLQDFFLLCGILEGLGEGGVFINAGSAVILPEVFLKALNYVRNKGTKVENFSTAVFDFIHHYRPYQNVVRRPVGEKGRGFYFVGPHELLIPLFAAALRA
jgi:hypothetical protein